MDSTETSLYTYKALGVGTINPSTVKNWGPCLEVKGNIEKKILVSTTLNDVRLGLYAHGGGAGGGGGGYIGTETNHPLLFLINYNEKLRLTTTGNVGINNSSPSYKLDVNGDINFTGTLYQNGSVFSSGGGGGGSSQWNKVNDNIVTDKAVGIGTDNPSTVQNWGPCLEVKGNKEKKMLVSTTYNDVRLGLYAHGGGAGGGGGGYIGTETNHPILFLTNYNEKVRITTDGNFGIGTTNPSQKLDVNGNINFTGDLYKSGSVLTLSNYSDSSTLVNDSTFVSNLYDKLHDNEINIYDTIKNACSTVSFTLGGSNYTCSGSFITFDNSDLQYGLFMTAAHCVMEVSGTNVLPTTELYVTNPMTGNYTKVDVNKIYYDGVADVALIRTNIDFSSNSSYPLQLSSVTPQTGDICFLCGNPGGLDNVSLSQGFIRDARFYENSGYQVPESLYIDTPGIGGNSGSPILNKNGKVIGIFTFGSSTTGMETFGGGSNLSVLNSTLPVLKTQALNGSTNKRNTSKYYMGLDYWTQKNAPFTWKTYYGGATTFPNQGVRIYTVTSGISPFDGVLGYLDILLSATIDGTEYKFGELTNQYPPGIMLYASNQSITIKYLDYSDSYTEKTASISLVTYASLGSSYDYLDAPLNTGASGRDPENVQHLCFPGKK